MGTKKAKKKHSRRIHSGRKGKRAERALLDPLTAWWGYKFHRTPSSGAWGTQHKNEEFSQDVICDDPNFPYDIEVKHCEGWHLEKLLTAPKNDIYRWWKQAVDQCAYDKKPMLCFKKNRHPFIVATRIDDTPKDIKGPVLTLYFEISDDESEVVDFYLLAQLVECDITQWPRLQGQK